LPGEPVYIKWGGKLERKLVVPARRPGELGKIPMSIGTVPPMVAVSHVFDEVTHGEETFAEDILVENPEHLAAVPVELEPLNHFGPVGAVLETDYDIESTAIAVHDLFHVGV